MTTRSRDASLSQFQRQMLRAVLSPDPPAAGIGSAVAALAREPAFAVYRNTAIAGCVEALRANYPAVARLVGDAWFAAAATEYVREHPPHCASLMRYGERWPAFLGRFPAIARLPYLPGVAWIDRAWTDAHLASDAQPADAGWLQSLDASQLAGLTLRPHPAARWRWFDAPVLEIWRRNRAGAPAQCGPDDAAAEPLRWLGGGVLVTRPAHEVVVTAIDAAGCRFLNRCRAGRTLQQAAAEVLVRRPDTDLAAVMRRLLVAGALAAPDAGLQSNRRPK
ncbi:MAG TPA: DNA-binding domain-containing protein [Burkholderiaceae bacterium]|nr:DNA-binding domain-containing protein [Burkholderiaceae bacterium]